MKILAISHSSVVDVNQRVFRELEILGHNVAVVVPQSWPHQYFSKAIAPTRLNGFGGEIIALPIWKAGSPPLHLYRVRPTKVIDRVKPDLVYIEQEPYSLAAFQWAIAARRRNVPTISYSLQNIVKKHPPLFRFSERIVLKTTSAAIVVSEEVAAVLRGRGYDGPIHIIPLSVDLSLFRPTPKDPDLAQTLQLRTPVIGYFGRLVSEKGIRPLLEAFISIRRETGGVLLIVGVGPLATACRQVEGTRVVTGVPHLDIPRYLALCDLLIVPSITTSRWKEQFGRVIIEALACGIPVVGSDSGAIPKLIKDTGGGLVVPEGNPTALARAVQLLLADNDLRLKLGKSARAAIGRYSTQRIASDFDAVFQGSVLSGHSPRVMEPVKAG